MNKTTIVNGVVGTVCAAALVGTIAWEWSASDGARGNAPLPQTTIQQTAEPSEDEPGWNCYIHGNESCGDAPVITLADGTEGAVLTSPANDGLYYISRKDGAVELLNAQHLAAVLFTEGE